MTGARLVEIGADLGLSIGDVAAEVGVPEWQLLHPGFTVLPDKSGGYETRFERSGSVSSVVAACLVLGVFAVAGGVGVWLLARVVW
jgi:hypothetical protein